MSHHADSDETVLHGDVSGSCVYLESGSCWSSVTVGHTGQRGGIMLENDHLDGQCDRSVMDWNMQLYVLLCYPSETPV